ncbi:hypothetical protein [Roseomonas sp. BN140053]|uniref:hypothetical protein n=1 Tax=Roseomonas sp. BN140053 TaxID=3391898 RepID=UPI0039E76A01
MSGALLEIDGGMPLIVVGSPDWFNGQPLVPAYIAATVRLPRGMDVAKLDSSCAAVCLTLRDGRAIEGVGMWRAGKLAVWGDQVTLRYEGTAVVKVA